MAAACMLSFASCDNYDEPNPQPQTNPQESIFQASEVAVANDLKPEVYDLTALQAEQENIKVGTITATSALPTGYAFGSTVEISANDFESAYAVPTYTVKATEGEGYEIYITPSALEEIYFENISKTPNDAVLKARVLVKTVLGKQQAIVGGPENYYGPFEMTIRPEMRRSYLYTPGNSNGWNQEASQRLFSYDANYYSGYAILGGEFKFTSEPNWDGTNYGAGDEPGLLSTDGGAGNLNADNFGLYYCTVDIEKLAYTTYYITTIGVIGDATPGSWNGSTALTSTDNLVWKGTVTFGDGEFKFRANDAWDVNLGGDMNNLEQGGANIPSPGAGTYDVTLDLSTIPYTCTLVKK